MDCKIFSKRLFQAMWRAALYTVCLWFFSVLYGGSGVWVVLFNHMDKKFCKSYTQTLDEHEYNSSHGIDFGTKNNSIHFINKTGLVTNNKQGKENLFQCLLRDNVVFRAMFILILAGSISYLCLFIRMAVKFFKEDYSGVKHVTITRNAQLTSVVTESNDIIIDSICSSPLVRLLKEEDAINMDCCEQIQKLVYDTWLYDERLGKDAKALVHGKITVKSVYKVENTSLWEIYNNQYEKTKQCKHPKELEMTPIKTMRESYYPNESQMEADNLLQCGDIQLRNNEIFLFHGTRLENIRNIIQNGFDLTKARDGLYGKAIYLAESSEKADQYTDYPSNRRKTNLAMLIVRVTKGKMRCHDKEKAVRMPYCGWIGSRKPKYNTVVAGLKKRFREFLVFDAKHTYPAFVVFYDRE